MFLFFDILGVVNILGILVKAHFLDEIIHDDHLFSCERYTRTVDCGPNFGHFSFNILF